MIHISNLSLTSVGPIGLDGPAKGTVSFYLYGHRKVRTFEVTVRWWPQADLAIEWVDPIDVVIVPESPFTDFIPLSDFPFYEGQDGMVEVVYHSEELLPKTDLLVDDQEWATLTGEIAKFVWGVLTRRIASIKEEWNEPIRPGSIGHSFALSSQSIDWNIKPPSVKITTI